MADVLIALGALVLLIAAAYRGFSVILFAPLAAMLAVLLTDPAAVPAAFSGLFMDKVATFLKLYFPVFLLGAAFGRLVEISGFSRALVGSVLKVMGAQRAMPAIVLVCALLTYGGVSLFVVVFAAYPFAAEMFRRTNIPKRLIPGTIALGAFTFTMDSLPGTPQIQNIIPTTFFGTSAWAAPVLGLVGSVFIFATGLAYLDWARRKAAALHEGYGVGHINEPGAPVTEPSIHAALALSPLLVVGVVNLTLTHLIPLVFASTVVIALPGLDRPLSMTLGTVVAIWAVEGALLAGIITVALLSFSRVRGALLDQGRVAVSGALLAGFNTASEYGFGAVIAALPGFVVIRRSLEHVPDTLINEAITVTTLAGVTGSASGGLSIALAAMADRFVESAQAAGISAEVLHRVAAMSSGGMDTLPHNGAVITLLAVTGLTHRQSYRNIFAITCIKTAAVAVVIVFYYLTGLY
jgi:H+/gluconate symporter-like permease